MEEICCYICLDVRIERNKHFYIIPGGNYCAGWQVTLNKNNKNGKCIVTGVYSECAVQ